MKALCLKELKMMLLSPLFYLLGALCSVLNGYVFWIVVQLSTASQGQSLSEMMALLFGGTFFFWLALLFMVPVLTMRLVSEEKRMGTMELLKTAPISTMDIVVAKYVSALALYVLIWLPTIAYGLILASRGPLDWGLVASCYLGLFLLGAMLLSIGLLCSCVLSHPVSSALVCFSVLMVLFSLGFTPMFSEQSWSGTWLDRLWLVGYLDDFAQGIVDSRRVGWLVGITGLSGCLSAWILSARDQRRSNWGWLALLVALLVMGNMYSERHGRRWDWSSEQRHSLSPKTKQLLQEVEETIEIVVFMQQTHALYGYLQDLLRQYQQACSRIKIQWVDPAQDVAKAKQLSAQLGVEQAATVVLRHGPRKRYVQDKDLAEYDYSGLYQGLPPELVSYCGEEAVSGAILSLQDDRSPVIYSTIGHGEKQMNNAEPGGALQWKKALQWDNFVLKDVPWATLESWPKDCALLVIAGPQKPFSSSEVQLLKAYLNSGGRLLCLLDPATHSNLEPLLAEYGIDVGLNVVVDPHQKLPNVSPANVLVVDYGAHRITRSLNNLATVFFLARSVTPLAGADKEQVWPLVFSSQEGWGEVDVNHSPFVFEQNVDVDGPVSLACAAQVGQTQVVVVGDSDFIGNGQLELGGNLDLSLAMVHWLTRQEQRIALGPKTAQRVQLVMSQRQITGVFVLVVVVLPLLWALLGAGVCYRRFREVRRL